MTTSIAFRNATPLPDGRIDCEIEHPVYGWIPFTADANDVEPHGRELHANLKASLQGQRTGEVGAAAKKSKQKGSD